MIRAAQKSDAGAIAEIHVQTWQRAYENLIPGSYLASLSVKERERNWQQAIEKEEAEVLLSESNSGVSGFIAFGACPDTNTNPETGEIAAIYVLPEFWSTGIGQELWKAAKSRLVERGFSTAVLWVLSENARAIQFYRSVGFTPDLTSEKEINIGGKALKEIRFEAAIG